MCLSPCTASFAPVHSRSTIGIFKHPLSSLSSSEVPLRDSARLAQGDHPPCRSPPRGRRSDGAAGAVEGTRRCDLGLLTETSRARPVLVLAYMDGRRTR